MFLLHWLPFTHGNGVTNLADVIAHCSTSPNVYGSLSMFCFVFKFFVGLCELWEICISNAVIRDTFGKR
jgi:hypothetical protein